MRRRQSGIALLEALLAVVILAIGLLGTLGLQARAYSAMAEASTRAEATMAAEKLLGLMSNDQANLAAYAVVLGATPSTRLATWYAETQAAIPNAEIIVTVGPVAGTARSVITVSIAWTRKVGSPKNTHSMTAYVSQSS